MPNDSGLSKVEAPGIKVTVSFPALMMSLVFVSMTSDETEMKGTYGSTSSSVGYGPYIESIAVPRKMATALTIPSIPFSD